MKSIAIMWFRRDLRLTDNPALTAAARHQNILPLWIDDHAEAGDRAPGAALRVWQHHALQALSDSLGGRLNLRKGPAQAVFGDLAQRFDVQAVYWNRCYEPWRMSRDAGIKSWLKDRGIQTESFNGSLLWEPWEIHKNDGTAYRVFTPFYRNGCLAAAAPRKPLTRPDLGRAVLDPKADDLAQVLKLPTRPWARNMMSHWQSGEPSAQAQIKSFLSSGLADYKEGRDFPARPNVSRLSPYLQTGEISPNQIWYAMENNATDENTQKFRSEIAWREFSYNLLWQHPNLHKDNIQAKFDRFAWKNSAAELMAWQRGQTGIPIVDAGMRELWHTGYMHNRVRMIVASFLVKNLRIDWRLGEAWFWDTLVDADPASNAASWQWVAGCGADAAPYFRVFNPITQAKKFDATQAYIHKWVPELRDLSANDLLSGPSHGIGSQDQYPKPLVDLKTSREMALTAFAQLKGEP